MSFSDAAKRVEDHGLSSGDRDGDGEGDRDGAERMRRCSPEPEPRGPGLHRRIGTMKMARKLVTLDREMPVHFDLDRNVPMARVPVAGPLKL